MQSRTALLSRRLRVGKNRSRHVRPTTRLLRVIPRASTQPTLLDIFSAVSEGRLSPLDAAQTVEEAICHVTAHRKSTFPQIVNGRGKRPDWIAGRIQELLREQGKALVTDMDPSDYATIRKTVPGVVYHAGAKTLRIDEAEAGEKLPGTVGIVSDISVPVAALEQLHTMAEFLGYYAFQIPSLTVTHLSGVMEHMKSVAQASVVLVIYDEETALPDIVAGSIEAPVISVRVGDHRYHGELPSNTLSAQSLLSAVLTVAKILKVADRLEMSRRTSSNPDKIEGGDDGTLLHTQFQTASELLNEVANEVQRVNNVVSKDACDASPTEERTAEYESTP